MRAGEGGGAEAGFVTSAVLLGETLRRGEAAGAPWSDA